MGRSFRTWPALMVGGALLCACTAGSGGPNGPKVLDNSQLPAIADSQPTHISALGQQVLQAINGQRRHADLRLEARLQRTASVHAADMVARNFRGHHNPDGQGPLDRMLAVDPDFNGTVGENIWVGTRASGQDDASFAQHVLQGWLNSPSHRMLLENTQYTQTGVGVATQGHVVYVVQTFSK